MALHDKPVASSDTVMIAAEMAVEARRAVANRRLSIVLDRISLGLLRSEGLLRVAQDIQDDLRFCREADA